MTPAMRLAAALLFAAVLPAMAQPGEPLAPPPMPEGEAATAPPSEEQELVEPQVTIVRREREIIEEYRVGNNLYMVKITPRSGPPYFLIDTDGDGSLETRRNELSNPEIPQWVLFHW